MNFMWPSILSIFLFLTGLLGVALSRENLVYILLSIQLMFLAVIINVLGASSIWGIEQVQPFIFLILGFLVIQMTIGFILILNDSSKKEKEKNGDSL